MPAEDVHAVKMVRRELNRRKIDSSLVDVRVSHGVVYLRGQVRPVRGGAPDLHAEIEVVVRALRTRPEFRDVIVDLVFRT